MLPSYKRESLKLRGTTGYLSKLICLACSFPGFSSQALLVLEWVDLQETQGFATSLELPTICDGVVGEGCDV